MARCVQDFDYCRADLENIPLFKILVTVFYRRTFVDIDIGTRGGFQFLIAADMVGMHMSVEYMGNLHAFFPRDV